MGNKTKMISIILIISICVVNINGHGEMVQPPNRGSAWRYDNRFPKNLYAAEWCQKVKSLSDRTFIEKNSRNAKCGICGPIYNDDPTVYTTVHKNGAGIVA